MDKKFDIAKYKEMVSGHQDIWECSLKELIDKVTPTIKDHMLKNKLEEKIINTACSFIRIKFDRKELKGTVDYEVSKAIEESLIYYTNCEGGN